MERDVRLAHKAGIGSAHALYALPEVERDLQVAIYEKDQRLHNGHDIAHCSDPDFKVYPQRQVCRFEMERQAADWWYGELHEDKPFHDGEFQRWSAERTKEFRYHFRDGVEIIVAEVDMYPDDKFLDDHRSDSPL